MNTTAPRSRSPLSKAERINPLPLGGAFASKASGRVSPRALRRGSGQTPRGVWGGGFTLTCRTTAGTAGGPRELPKIPVAPGITGAGGAVPALNTLDQLLSRDVPTVVVPSNRTLKPTRTMLA